MIPVMAIPAQRQIFSFLKFTKSALLAGTIMLLLMLFPITGKANHLCDFPVSAIKAETFDIDTLELPETPASFEETDTIPPRGRNERRTRGDTTTVILPDTLLLPRVVPEEDVTIEEPEDQEEYFPEIKEHSPLRATMLSATLPGLGQAYNGKYWKIPFLYAGIGGVIYAVDFNNRQYQHFRKNWVARVDGNPNTQDEYPNQATDRLQREMNRWRRNVEISYIMGAALYILNILDATVDAHLLDFDVGEDLTLNVMPVVIPQNSTFGNRMNPASPGIRLSFRF